MALSKTASVHQRFWLVTWLHIVHIIVHGEAKNTYSLRENQSERYLNELKFVSMFTYCLTTRSMKIVLKTWCRQQQQQQHVFLLSTAQRSNTTGGHSVLFSTCGDMLISYMDVSLSFFLLWHGTTPLRSVSANFEDLVCPKVARTSDCFVRWNPFGQGGRVFSRFGCFFHVISKCRIPLALLLHVLFSVVRCPKAWMITDCTHVATSLSIRAKKEPLEYLHPLEYCPCKLLLTKYSEGCKHSRGSRVYQSGQVCNTYLSIPPCVLLLFAVRTKHPFACEVALLWVILR